MGKSFQDLVVWQRAIDLISEIFRLTEALASNRGREQTPDHQEMIANNW